MNAELAQSQAAYRTWLGELKSRFRQVQIKAAVSVNTALLQFYWELGADIVTRQTEADWGSGFLKQLSADLMHEFPEMKGFSASNLKYIRQWYSFYAASSVIGQQAVGKIGQQPVAQLPSIEQIERELGLDDAAETRETGNFNQP